MCSRTTYPKSDSLAISRLPPFRLTSTFLHNQPTAGARPQHLEVMPPAVCLDTCNMCVWRQRAFSMSYPTMHACCSGLACGRVRVLPLTHPGLRSRCTIVGCR